MLWGGLAEALTVTVPTKTNTQLVLKYTAPSTTACTVEVSESNTYSPLVHDVNTTLFSGAASDNRAGSLGAGTVNRVFIAGTRTAALAADAKYYSRALQANTTHYYRVTCGGDVATGSATTTNIPVGSTFADPPTPDPNSPGDAIWPTLSASDRTQTIIDPGTGALIRRLTLLGDVSSPDSVFGFGEGNQDACTHAGLSNGGYHCFIQSTGGKPAVLYWIHPGTGEVRYLGYLVASGAFTATSLLFVYWDESDPNVMYATSVVDRYIIKGTYSGTDSAVAQETFADITWTLPAGATPISTLVDTFDSSFDPAKFDAASPGDGCKVINVQGRRLLIRCYRGIQDTYAWHAVYDLDTGTVIAAMKHWENPTTRWCATHAPNKLDVDWYWVTNQFLSGSSALGAGPYSMTQVGSLSSSATALSVTSTCPGGFGSCVTGDPVSSTDDKWLQAASVGDIIRNATTGEMAKITGKASATSLTIQRGYFSTAQAASAGDLWQMWCRYAGVAGQGIGNESYWDYENDPSGTDGTESTVIMDWNPRAVGGHATGRNGYMVQEKYGVTPGTVPSRLSISTTSPNPPSSSYDVSGAATFAGKTPPGGQGVTYGSYPSFVHLEASANEKKWFVDTWAFWGSTQISSSSDAALVGGTSQVYKYTNIDTTFGGLHRKHLPTFGSSGEKFLRDISGPGSSITDSTNYTFCVAAAAGECRGGSSAGDIYISAPSVAVGNRRCLSQVATLDLCLHDFNAYGLSDAQFGIEQAGPDTGDYNRVIWQTRRTFKWLVLGSRGLPDGSHLIGTLKGTTGTDYQSVLVKLPAYPAPDGVNRSQFLGLSITVPAPTWVAGATKAVVEFGYAEYGTVAQKYCTTRADTCVAETGSLSQSSPFKWKAIETPVGLACASGCTIVVPTLPGRVVYWQIHYLNDAGTYLTQADHGVGAERTMLAMGAPPLGSPPPPVIVKPPKKCHPRRGCAGTFNADSGQRLAAEKGARHGIR